MSGLIFIAMVAMAANSVLSRGAIENLGMDPLVFAGVRLLSGAAILVVIVVVRSGLPKLDYARFISAFWLLTYVLPFSLAYETLPSGVGALVMFGIVQITMFTGSTVTGTYPTLYQILGMVVAMVGLSWVLWPSESFDFDVMGIVFMVIAGVGWGLFCLQGRGCLEPLVDTAMSFILCLPVAIVLMCVGDADSWDGLSTALAIISGALTSGLGYTLWYHILPQIAETTAAVAQLSVPVIAMCLGVIVLGEEATWQLLTASAIVIGGITISLQQGSVVELCGLGDEERDKDEGDKI